MIIMIIINNIWQFINVRLLVLLYDVKCKITFIYFLKKNYDDNFIENFHSRKQIRARKQYIDRDRTREQEEEEEKKSLFIEFQLK